MPLRSESDSIVLGPVARVPRDKRKPGQRGPGFQREVLVVTDRTHLSRGQTKSEMHRSHVRPSDCRISQEGRTAMAVSQ